MKLNIGEIIKKLRKEKEITQEEFAELIGVSSQSVSRWENNLCYPDIELIPVIADFFGVSTDMLMGMDESNEKQAVNSILEDFQNAISKGRIDDCISIARKGVKEFPNNYILLDKLMYALFVSGDDDGNIPEWKENMEKYDDEITALGERIMKYCPDQNIRLAATARLAFNHCIHGRKEIGKQIYSTLPSMESCREKQIWWSLDKDEKLPFLQKSILQSYEMLRSFIWLLADADVVSVEIELEAINKVFELEKLILEDNRPKNSWGDVYLNYAVAEKYAILNDFVRMYEYLHIAVENAKAFDTRPDDQTYKSFLVGEITVRKHNFETTDSRPLCKILRDKWLQDKEFDCVRNSDEFQSILNEL